MTPDAKKKAFSKGLEGIIAGETSICSITTEGELTYRGFAIEDLAENCVFEDVLHLLLYENFPYAEERPRMKEKLFQYRTLPEPVMNMIRQIPKEVPLMDVLRTGVSFAGHFHPIKAEDSKQVLTDMTLWLISTASTIISTRYRLLDDKEPLRPKAGLSHAAELLYQCWGKEPDATSERILGLTLVLYAEHEFNASTFSCRVCASTLSDIISAVVAGIGTLKGPLHGGANEEALKLILSFKTPEAAREWTQAALKQKKKVMGFGHRVYKHGDHRAKVLEPEMRKLAAQKGREDLLAVYDAIKDVMINKPKPIYPNVDYPAGLTYYLLDLPPDLFTPLFVASRTLGWCAHFIEQHFNNRILRPLAQYTGEPLRRTKDVRAKGRSAESGDSP